MRNYFGLEGFQRDDCYVEEVGLGDYSSYF